MRGIPAGWGGRASFLRNWEPMQAACAEVGRDPGTLELTVGQIVTFPGLANEDDFSGEGERFVFASAEELADAWRNLRPKASAI